MSVRNSPEGVPLTEYQKTHRPVRVLERKCPSKRFVWDGGDWKCSRCGRLLKNKSRHKPNWDFMFGGAYYYGDGSVVYTDGKMAPLKCARCGESLDHQSMSWHYYDEAGFITANSTCPAYHDWCAPGLTDEALRDCCPACKDGEPCEDHKDE